MAARPAAVATAAAHEELCFSPAWVLLPAIPPWPQVVTAAVGDANMRSLKQGDVIQVKSAGWPAGCSLLAVSGWRARWLATAGLHQPGSRVLLWWYRGASRLRPSVSRSGPCPAPPGKWLCPTSFLPPPLILQLERKGYFIVDAPFQAADKPLVLLNIPDGRARVFPGEPINRAAEA